MLTFTRDKEVIQTIDINNKDPLSLYTYQEILQKEQAPLFSLLVCETSRFVYLASDIVEMRYSLDEQINVYTLKDPLSREIVEDVWFFEVKKNPFYRNILKIDLLENTKHRNIVDESTVNADFISNELGVLYDRDLQHKILNYKRETGDVLGLIVYILVVIFSLFLLIFTLSASFSCKIQK